MGYVIKSSGIIESGTWTPVLISQTGACANTFFNQSYYTRINNIATCYVYAYSDFNFLLTSIGEVIFTVPITSSSVLPIGLGSMSGNTDDITISAFQNIGTNIRFDFRSAIFLNTAGNYILSFQYEIN